MMSEPRLSCTCTRPFRAEEQLRAVEVRTEGRPFLGDRRQILEAEDLEAAAVGQDRSGPVHEAVETAEALDQLMAGPDEEMVGVAEDDLGPHLQQILRGHRLDGGLGADRHEDRRLEDAVPGPDLAAPGGTFAGSGMKGEWVHGVPGILADSDRRQGHSAEEG